MEKDEIEIVKCYLCKWEGNWKYAEPVLSSPTMQIDLRCPTCGHLVTKKK